MLQRARKKAQQLGVTVENVKISGLSIEKVTDLASGIFKLIEARKKIN
jgi:hypothetical protein